MERKQESVLLSCYVSKKLQICRLLGLIAPVFIKFLQICRLLGYFFNNEAELEEKDAYLQEFPNLIGFFLGKPAFLQEFLVPLQPDSSQPAPTSRPARGQDPIQPLPHSNASHSASSQLQSLTQPRVTQFPPWAEPHLNSHYSPLQPLPYAPNSLSPTATEPHSRAKSQAPR